MIQRTKIFRVALLLAVMWLGAVSVCNAQEVQTRFIGKQPSDNEPFKITKITAKGSEVTLGKSFMSTDDWLDGLTIEVENTSGKPIKALGIHVYLSSQTSVSTYLMSLRYGLSGDDLLGEDFNPSPQPSILPGDKVKLVFSHKQYERVQRLLLTNPSYGNPTKAEMVLRNTYFEDGSLWDQGTTFHRSKNGDWVQDTKDSGKVSPSNNQRNIARVSFLSARPPVAACCGDKAEMVKQRVCFNSLDRCTVYEIYYQINCRIGGGDQNVRITTFCACDNDLHCVLNTVACGKPFNCN